MEITKFEDIDIWKTSIQTTCDIYKLTSKLKFSKDFGLKDQIQRASVSISSNIVEGFESRSNKLFIRYLKIAKGSAGEVRSQLYIVLALHYIDQQEFDKINNNMLVLIGKIGALINYLSKEPVNP